MNPRGNGVQHGAKRKGNIRKPKTKPHHNRKYNQHAVAEHSSEPDTSITPEDIQALKIHGLYYENDGFSSDSGLSCFDEEYYEYKPKPIKFDINRIKVIEKRKQIGQGNQRKQRFNETYRNTTYSRKKLDRRNAHSFESSTSKTVKTPMVVDESEVDKRRTPNDIKPSLFAFNASVGSRISAPIGTSQGTNLEQPISKSREDQWKTPMVVEVKEVDGKIKTVQGETPVARQSNLMNVKWKTFTNSEGRDMTIREILSENNGGHKRTPNEAKPSSFPSNISVGSRILAPVETSQGSNLERPIPKSKEIQWTDFRRILNSDHNYSSYSLQGEVVKPGVTKTPTYKARIDQSSANNLEQRIGQCHDKIHVIKNERNEPQIQQVTPRYHPGTSTFLSSTGTLLENDISRHSTDQPEVIVRQHRVLPNEQETQFPSSARNENAGYEDDTHLLEETRRGIFARLFCCFCKT